MLRLPPVRGFWSLTMYSEQVLFVANPIDRYSTSLRTKPVFEPDGSLLIYIQTESQGADREANWLPAASSPLLAGGEPSLDHRRLLGGPARGEGGLKANASPAGLAGQPGRTPPDFLR